MLTRVGPVPDDQALAEADLSGLVDSFVGKSSRARNDTDTAALVDEAGHDADLALARRDDSGAVGADETSIC